MITKLLTFSALGFSLFSPITVNRRQNNEPCPKKVAPAAVVIVSLVLKNLRLSVHHDPGPFETGILPISPRPDHLPHRKAGIDRIGSKGRLAFCGRLGDRDAYAMISGQIDWKGACRFKRSRSQRLPVHVHVPVGTREIRCLDGSGVVQVVPVHVDIGLHLVGLGEARNNRPIQEVLGKIVRVVALEGNQTSRTDSREGILAQGGMPGVSGPLKAVCSTDARKTRQVGRRHESSLGADQGRKPVDVRPRRGISALGDDGPDKIPGRRLEDLPDDRLAVGINGGCSGGEKAGRDQGRYADDGRFGSGRDTDEIGRVSLCVAGQGIRDLADFLGGRLIHDLSMLGLEPPGNDRAQEDRANRRSDHHVEGRSERPPVGLEKGPETFPKMIFSFHGEFSHQVPVWVQDDVGSEGDPPGWKIQL